jgi:hypothetical protein
MTMTKIPDVTFEIDGEHINIEQDSGCGEVHCILNQLSALNQTKTLIKKTPYSPV